MAGLTPAYMDMVSIYDCYTITALLSLEDAGFCEKGKGLQFVAEHDLTFRGDFREHLGRPARLRPGRHAGGMHHVCERPRQIMGRSGATQVADCNRAFVSVMAGSCPNRPPSCWKATDMATFAKPIADPDTDGAAVLGRLGAAQDSNQYSPSADSYVFYPRCWRRARWPTISSGGRSAAPIALHLYGGLPSGGAAFRAGRAPDPCGGEMG